jgi:hypothetical protein
MNDKQETNHAFARSRSNVGLCSGLSPNDSGGHSCKHGHATTAACYGNGYPTGTPVPVCVREDRIFDEEYGRVTIAPWDGA